MSSIWQELLSTSATRVLPTLAVSNLFFYTCYKTTGKMTWVDVGWAANHALAGILHFYFNNSNKSLEAKLYLALLVFWAARLGFHLGKRCFSGPSDPRYDKIPNRLNLRKSFQALFQFEFRQC